MINKIQTALLPSPIMKRSPWSVLLGASYIALIWFLGGLKMSHVIIGSLSLLYVWNEKSRRLIICFLPMILTGVAFDSMRYYYWQGIEGNIRVAEPYEYEKILFGIYDSVAQKTVTPNEYYEFRIYKSLDLICGFAYLFFVAEYLSAGFTLYFLKKFRLMLEFSWCFLTVNIMGFITYFIYPAAPPWYVTKYGFGPALMHVKPSAAAAIRFDEILGTSFFTAMYGEGIDVYGSIPSLHVSYPFMVIWVAIAATRGLGFLYRAVLIGFAVSFYVLMCFSAVYLQHHYVIDVVIGTIYALLAIILVKTVFFLIFADKKDIVS